MISNLLFDFGATLDGPLHWLDRFLAQYREAGLDITRGQLDPAFDHATQAGYRAIKVVRRFELLDLVRFLAGNQMEFLAHDGPDELRVRLASMDSGRRHRMVEQITAGFVKATREGLESSRAVLKTLRPRFRIGVVSNFYGNLDRILEEAGMRKIVEAVADSTLVGVFKPEPGIFEAALRMLRAAQGETAMIGDSRDKDCAPAARLGLRTVWYRANNSVHPDRGPEAIEPDFTISSLDEVATLQW